MGFLVYLNMGEFGNTESSVNFEAVSKKEPTVAKIIREKESVAIIKGVSNIENSLIGSQSTYYEGVLSRPLHENIDSMTLGDYGNRDNFVNNYILNLVFETGGYKNKDGKILTVEDIRGEARQSAEKKPDLHYFAENGLELSCNFFGGGKEFNFDTWMVGINDEIRKKMLNRVENIPGNQWISKLVEKTREKRDQMISDGGLFVIGDESLKNIKIDDDLLFFIRKLNLPFEGDIKDLKNFKEDIFLEIGHKRELFIKIKKNTDDIDGNSVNLSLLVDTEKMSGGSEADWFAVSDTAGEILGAFDLAGLKISDEMLNYISEGALGDGEFSFRYGNGYADLTRLLSYCIRSKDRGEIAKKLFSDFNELVLEKLKSNSEKMSGPAKLVVDMIGDLLDPKRDSKKSDFVYKKSDRTMRDGSCKDVEVYYEMALEERRNTVDDDFFYQKTSESNPTAITRREIVVNGVRLSKGFLCRVNPSGVEPIRPTMFSFNKDEAIDAYGKQYYGLLRDSPRLGDLIERNSKNWAF